MINLNKKITLKAKIALIKTGAYCIVPLTIPVILLWAGYMKLTESVDELMKNNQNER